MSFGELVTELTKELKSLKTMETEVAIQKLKVEELKARVIERMKRDQMTSTKVNNVGLTLVKQTKPSVTDWTKVYEYVIKNDAFDLLHKRLSSTAYADRLAAGENIEGVDVYESTIIKVSL